MTVAENWHAHDHEPWIAAWNYWDTNVLFSGTPFYSRNSPRLFFFFTKLLTGGDDLKMKGWDVRQGFGSPVFENRR